MIQGTQETCVVYECPSVGVIQLLHHEAALCKLTRNTIRGLESYDIVNSIRLIFYHRLS